MKLTVSFFVIAASAFAQTHSSSALKPGLYAIFNTSLGDITAELYEKYVPIAVSNFVGLAQGTKAWKDPKTGNMVKRPLFQNVTFHRVIRGVMIQSGDP